MDQQLVRISRFLSFVLRHRPDAIGLELDSEGWASVSELVRPANRAGRNLDDATIRFVVETNDKQRFTLSSDGRRIRAAQGHSIDIDLGLEPAAPPEVLFHGTVSRNLASILRDGLRSGGRHHVHLSPDEPTATGVGSRRGRPVVLRVDARGMHDAGHVFFVSENGVWLTEVVPPEFITFP